ncbi:MAG: hypothetical protein H7838_05645 [Magnetococcus sp. DMHC-8]
MSYAELIKKLADLPRDKQEDVLAFVEWLSNRRAGDGGLPPAHHPDWQEADFADLSMVQALRGMEDDPVVYSMADLQERWRMTTLLVRV